MLKIHIFLALFVNNILCGDIFYNINNNKVLHKVSDKFLSISIDPAVILAGVNLSDTSLLLARNLSPAFIRLAGPSTPFVKYLDNEEDLITLKIENQTNVIITPSMWFGINEWFNLASLTPVYGINDEETDKGVWDPKSTIPLLEMSDKFGVSCYWQLGYDCSNKTIVRYVEDLNILKQTLKGFPDHKDTWKIVGSDLSRCIYDALVHQNLETYIEDLNQNIDAVFWESLLISKEDLGVTKASIWTSAPKDINPVTFSSAMDWARRVGEAAQMKYDVIFRHPRLLEITHDTPVYWFSLLYKKLMGRTVLNIAPTYPSFDLTTFAHCTKRQNNYVRAGAVTILIINNGTETSTANIIPGNILFGIERSMDIHTYLLSANDASSTEIFLNDQKLAMEMLTKPDDILKPKLRRAKIKTHITLEVPAQTIGYFVLTDAQNSLCIQNEDDANYLLSEINEDQLVTEESKFKIEGRTQNVKGGRINNRVKNGMTLESIKNNILNEMELDKKYYGKIQKLPKLNNIKSTLDQFTNKQEIVHKKETLHKHLKDFIEKTKHIDVSDNSEQRNTKDKYNRHALLPTNLQFSINEIEDILKRRAKAKAEDKNIKFTSRELDILVNKATIKLPKHMVGKRDINRMLLEEKANFHKNNMFSQEAYERYAKEHNLFPRLKFRRSNLGSFRARRDIKLPLMKSKGLREPEKCALDENDYFNGNSRDPHRSKLNVRRDINLDMLKKRSGPRARNDRHTIIVQPNYLDEDDEPRSKIGPNSDELLQDVSESADYSKEIPGEHKWLKDMDISDIDHSDFENSLENRKFKYKSPTKPNSKRKFSKIGDKSSGYDSNEYLKVLEAWKEFGKSTGYNTCDDNYGFSHEDKKPSKNEKLSKLLRSDNYGKHKKGKSIALSAIDLDDYNLSDEFEYEFYKKKRELNNKKKAAEENLESTDKQNITKLAVSSNEHFGIQKLNYSTRVTSNKAKRSLLNNNLNGIFGQYQPITTGLRPWKPMDILGLQNNYFGTLPVYNWIQQQNLKNALLHNQLLLGLRKRRYIKGNSINSIENEIVSDEEINKNYKDVTIKPENPISQNREIVLEEKNNMQNEGVNGTFSDQTFEKISLKSNESSVDVDDLVSPKKLTYLERVLGKQNAKPIEYLIGKIKQSYNSINNNLSRLIKK